MLKRVDYKHKVKFVRDTADELGVSLDDCVYVGDDVNDIEAFEIVGLAIAFNSRKDVVKQKAHVVIDDLGRDLRAILPHLRTKRQLIKL